MARRRRPPQCGTAANPARAVESGSAPPPFHSTGAPLALNGPSLRRALCHTYRFCGRPSTTGPDAVRVRLSGRTLRVDATDHVRIAVDAYPGRKFEGKITTIEPQIATDTRNIRVQSSCERSSNATLPKMPALLMTASTRPKVTTAASTTA